MTTFQCLFFLLYCVHKIFSEITTISGKQQSSAILEQQESRTSEILETGRASAIPEHTHSQQMFLVEQSLGKYISKNNSKPLTPKLFFLKESHNFANNIYLNRKMYDSRRYS